MRKLTLLIAITLIAPTIYSCKLDPPILPGDKGYVQQYPPQSGAIGSTGSTGATDSTGSVSNSALTGKWTVQTTTEVVVVDGKISSSQILPANVYTDVVIDDGAKTMKFDGSSTVFDTPTYTLSGSGSNIKLQLSEDPFSRSSNGTISITQLTSTSMTWLALDPQVSTLGGHSMQGGFEITYTK